MRRLWNAREFRLFLYYWAFLFLLLRFSADKDLEERFISDFYTHSKRVAKDSVLDGVR